MNNKLTYLKLQNWINEKFKELEIFDYEVFKVERTYYTSDAYESGAAKLNIWFKDIASNALPDPFNKSHFLCFYSLKELNEYLSNGQGLFLTFRDSRDCSLNNMEIGIIK